MSPSAILIDGNGILHEKGAGVACFVGVRTGLPTIGVAKNLYNIDGLQKNIVKDQFFRSFSNFHHDLQHIDEMKLSRIKGCKSTLLVVSTNCIHDVAQNSVASERLYITKDLEYWKKHFLDAKCALALKLRGNSGKYLGAAVSKSDISKLNDLLQAKNPVYVSVGHRVSLTDAIAICSELMIYRIPEPIRQADLVGRKILRDLRKSVNFDV